MTKISTAVLVAISLLCGLSLVGCGHDASSSAAPVSASGPAPTPGAMRPASGAMRGLDQLKAIRHQ